MFTCLQLTEFIHQTSRRLNENQALLNDLDNRIGDGDHGTNIARGFSAACVKLDSLGDITMDGKNLGELSSIVTMELLSRVGGASGPLYGTVFMKFTQVWKGQHAISDTLLADGISAALDGVMARGKATEGEKTMVDVWSPVVAYLKTSENVSWHEVAAIAEQSALQTKGLIATKGRAAYLGQRSIGTCDPGSVSSAIFFEELSDIMAKGVHRLEWQTLVFS